MFASSGPSFHPKSSKSVFPFRKTSGASSISPLSSKHLLWIKRSTRSSQLHPVLEHPRNSLPSAQGPCPKAKAECWHCRVSRTNRAIEAPQCILEQNILESNQSAFIQHLITNLLKEMAICVEVRGYSSREEGLARHHLKNHNSLCLVKLCGSTGRLSKQIRRVMLQ